VRRQRPDSAGLSAWACRPEGRRRGPAKLRYENRRACLGCVEGVQHPGRIDAGTAGQADAFARQQASARTGEKRHVESGDVFQQGGEGSTFVCGRRRGRLALRRDSATVSMPLRLRHTPFGAPVVPEVKVILAVPCGKAAGRGSRRASSLPKRGRTVPSLLRRVLASRRSVRIRSMPAWWIVW
jgi:hypothetical protein